MTQKENRPRPILRDLLMLVAGAVLMLLTEQLDTKTSALETSLIGMESAFKPPAPCPMSPEQERAIDAILGTISPLEE